MCGKEAPFLDLPRRVSRPADRKMCVDPGLSRHRTVLESN